jgi:hypothetical protein
MATASSASYRQPLAMANPTLAVFYSFTFKAIATKKRAFLRIIQITPILPMASNFSNSACLGGWLG